jgi:SAM-dependent methyltransferase
MAADRPTAEPAPADWHRYSTARRADDEVTNAVTYGEGLPTEADLRLLGPVDGRRILDLGCGAGHNAALLAQQGAKVIAVDTLADHLERARSRAERAAVRVELHQAQLAELPFLRSDSIDAALSVMALATEDDLARVFRQVHRVLKPEASFVLTLPHPAFALFDPTAEDPLRVVRRYDDHTAKRWELDDRDVIDHPRTFGELFTTLHRGGFHVDQVIEPIATPSGPRTAAWADLMRTVPATLLLRARKQGN